MAIDAEDTGKWGDLEPQDSSCVESSSWLAGDMQVNFTDGTSYTYHRVSPLVYANFLRVLSKGWFFNKYIRDNYNYD